MERVAIYTCIIGFYDTLKQPSELCPGMDYICFVGPGEKTAERVGVWQIRELEGIGIKDPGLLSRYPKMHPHLLLSEYDASLWIDANIEIMDSSIYRAVRTKLSAGVKYSGVKHPSRDNAYDEAIMCRNMGYISYLKLARIFLFLLTHGQKRRGSFLMENNLIFRRHKDPQIVTMDKLWWDKVVHLCRRDQISFGWCLQKCSVRRDYLLPRGQSTRNHPGFRYLPHEAKGGGTCAEKK